MNNDHDMHLTDEKQTTELSGRETPPTDRVAGTMLVPIRGGHATHDTRPVWGPMMGRYVCVHSTPSAWFGYALDIQDANGLTHVLLADAALWAQGMTKDLVRPGSQMSEPPHTRRLGLVWVMATAIQPAGSIGPCSFRNECGSTASPGQHGAIIRHVAALHKMSSGEAFKAILACYGQPKADGIGDEKTAIEFVKGHELNLPDRVVASIVLDAARQGVW